MPTHNPTTSVLFQRWREGEDAALQHLMPIVYDELHRLAQRHLRSERADHTLQPTALIHEVYLRLLEQGPGDVESRCRFVAWTSHLMRQVLVDHARQRLAQKRQGGCRITLSEQLAASEPEAVDVLEVDDALSRLSRLDPQQARVVELRYFGGLSIRETAQALGISEATVKRDWTTARAWLHREIHDRDPTSISRDSR